MTKVIEQYRELYDELKSERLKEPAWLRDLREEAMSSFVRQGFPTVKEESWRYTDVSGIAGKVFLSDPEASRTAFKETEAARQGLDGYFLLFINGWFRPQLSDAPKGIRVQGLADALLKDPELFGRLRAFGVSQVDPFLNLNTALGESGVLIEIPGGVEVDRPTHIVHWTDAREGLCQPRTIVTAGKGSRTTLIETYRGKEGRNYLTNASTVLVLEEDAVLRHYKVQQEASEAFHIASLRAEQKERSVFSSLSVAIGGKLTRYSISVELAGEATDCRLFGLCLGESDQHFDQVTRIDHAKPAGKSEQLFKGILAGSSRGVFTGRVLVRPGAQKTDARQTSRNLLLSEGAKADARPQLEILADDVKCSHGAAVGQLDEDSVFYLRSRGIGERLAQKMLAEGFARELTCGIADENWKSYLDKIVSEKLTNLGIGAA